MRRFSGALLSIAAIALSVAPTVAAIPAAQSPVGGTGAHPHHVHTGSGCVTLDAVLFEPDETRGLHGASARTGHEKGPFHGPCHP